MGWSRGCRGLRLEKLHAQQNCRQHNGKPQQGIRILLSALLVRILIVGQETSCCVQFPHCYFSANASTTRSGLLWMLDFLLSRSFLDVTGVDVPGRFAQMRVYLSYPFLSPTCRLWGRGLVTPSAETLSEDENRRS